MNTYFSKHYASINNIDPDNPDSIKQWYEKNSEFYDRELNEIFDSDLTEKRIVDLGCGIGGLLKYLKLKGANNICGVDFSSEQVNVCAKYVTTDVHHEDIFDFLSRDYTFDIIFAFDLIEHIKKERIIHFIELMYNKLTVGGKIIIRTPNMGSVTGLKSRYMDFTHEIGFTEESITQVFNQINFTKIEVKNAYIGGKRLFAVKAVNRLIKMFYNVNMSKIVTPNLILVAQK